MKYLVTMPREIHQSLMAHLFQNDLEQGAFLFARPAATDDALTLSR